MSMDVIGERRLQARRDARSEPWEVVVRVGRPEPDPEPGGNWRCPLQIVGIGEAEVFHAYGVDAVQALQLGLQMLGVKLRSAQGRELSLSWLDDADLGLPVP